MENRTALVTGGSGYLGSILSKKLKQGGWNVVLVDIKPPEHDYYDAYYPHNLAFYEETRYVFLKHKFDVVFHLAGRIEVGESMKHPTVFWKNNVATTALLLDLMVEFGVNNIVFSSTAAVYWPGSRPITENECLTDNSVYGNTKRACEMSIEDSRLNYTIFRYFNLSGAEDDLGENHEPETHLIPNIFKNLNNFTVFGNEYDTKDGTCVRDYVHVSDVADAHIAAAEKMIEKNLPLGIFNLGTGQGYTILEIIQLIEANLGIKVNYNLGAGRHGDPDCLVADITLAQKVLNYKPKHDIISILKTSYEWFKKNDRRKN